MCLESGVTVESCKLAQLAERVAKLKKEYKDIFGEITKDRSVSIAQWA